MSVYTSLARGSVLILQWRVSPVYSHRVCHCDGVLLQDLFPEDLEAAKLPRVPSEESLACECTSPQLHTQFSLVIANSWMHSESTFSSLHQVTV